LPGVGGQKWFKKAIEFKKRVAIQLEALVQKNVLRNN